MAELMRLWQTYLGPASDTLLDLGASSFRWNNAYFFGTISTNILGGTRVNADSSTITILQNSRMTTGSATVTTLLTTNGSRATLNTVVLQQTALTVQNGDIWFMASSNQLYLFARSNGINFYVAMGTTNAYPAL